MLLQNPRLCFSEVYDGPESPNVRDIIATSDGGYAVVGSVSANQEPPEGEDRRVDVFFVKVGSDGQFQDAKSIGGPEDQTARCVQQTADGGFLVAGWATSYSAGGTGMLLLRLDADGTEIWRQVDEEELIGASGVAPLTSDLWVVARTVIPGRLYEPTPP